MNTITHLGFLPRNTQVTIVASNTVTLLQSRLDLRIILSLAARYAQAFMSGTTIEIGVRTESSHPERVAGEQHCAPKRRTVMVGCFTKARTIDSVVTPTPHSYSHAQLLERFRSEVSDEQCPFYFTALLHTLSLFYPWQPCRVPYVIQSCPLLQHFAIRLILILRVCTLKTILPEEADIPQPDR